jgi:hypothetical protein
MIMRKLLLGFLLAMLLAVLQGCFVTSVHPLYRSPADMTFDPELVGRWEDKGTVWEFTERIITDQPSTYMVTITEKGEPVGILEGALVEIDGHQFIDLYPYDFEYTASMKDIQKSIGSLVAPLQHGGDNTPPSTGTNNSQGLWFNNALLFPSHTVIQIRRTGNTLGVAFLSFKWFTDRAEECTLELAHEVQVDSDVKDDDLIIVTATSEELQAFMRRYADNEDVFEFEELRRE